MYTCGAHTVSHTCVSHGGPAGGTASAACGTPQSAAHDATHAKVGNGAADHAVWGRPEDVAGPVPAYVVTAAAPGSDAVGAMGAALAAASVAFRRSDTAYRERLLAAATNAYTCAHAQTPRARPLAACPGASCRDRGRLALVLRVQVCIDAPWPILRFRPRRWVFLQVQQPHG